MKNKTTHNTLLYSILCLLFNCSLLTGQVEEKNRDLSPNFECGPPELKIKHFRDDGTNKNNKVVVGRPIEFKASPTNGENYQWGIGNVNGDLFNPYWDFTPVTAQGTATIPVTSATMPMNNADFGITHGETQVSAIIEGEQQNALSTTEMFFDKDEVNPHNLDEPNWFYYWSKIPDVTNSLTLPGIKLYQEDSSNPNNYILNSIPTPIIYLLIYAGGEFSLESSNLYGSNSIGEAPRGVFVDIGQDNERFVLTELKPEKLKIRIYDGASKIFAHRIVSSNGVIVDFDGSGSTGIACFWEILQHELEHYRIFERFWSLGYNSRTESGMDVDTDRDYYPRHFEEMNLGAPYFFDPLQSDAYDASNYDPSTYVTNPNNIDPNVSAGTNYEEVICRMYTDNLNNPNQLNLSDWSFSEESAYQGKNW